MNHARGVTIITDPIAGVQEVDTFTCCHCQQIVDKPPRVAATDGRIGAWCTCCDAAMCLDCVGKGCTPIQRWLDQQEKRRWIAEAC